MVKMKHEVAIVPVLVIIALTLSLVLSGCGDTTNQNDPKKEKYYVGREGVDINLESNTPPARIYYDSRSENEFEIDVKVHNKGPSYSRGAVFVSGFDPDMIQFDGMNIPEYTYRDCYLDWDAFAGIGSIFFGCDDLFDFRGDDNGYWDLGLELSEILQKKFGWDMSVFDIEIGGQGGEVNSLQINWDNMANIDATLHGQALMTIEPFAASLGTGGMGKVFLLRPDNYEFPGGDMSHLNFHGMIGNWPMGLDETDQTFLITSCYLYETYSAPLVCIDPDPYSMSKKVCTPQTQTWSGGQGAPVAVTSIEQENTPNKIFFTIHVANVGGGKIYNTWSLGKCSPYSQGRTTVSDLNNIRLEYVKIGQDLLTCSPENRIIRLDETGRGQITCEYDIRYATAKSAYKTPLIIALWYGYEEHTQKTVHFKRVG